MYFDIREYCVEYGLTIKEFALRCNIPSGRMYAIAARRCNPNMEDLSSIERCSGGLISRYKIHRKAYHIWPMRHHPKVEVKKDETPYQEILDYLNNAVNKNYSHKTAEVRKLIRGRFAEGRTLEDFKTVIDNQVKRWSHDNKMRQYIRPLTLFRPANFDNYLQPDTQYKEDLF